MIISPELCAASCQAGVEFPLLSFYFVVSKAGCHWDACPDVMTDSALRHLLAVRAFQVSPTLSSSAAHEGVVRIVLQKIASFISGKSARQATDSELVHANTVHIVPMNIPGFFTAFQEESVDCLF